MLFFIFVDLSLGKDSVNSVEFTKSISPISEVGKLSSFWFAFGQHVLFPATHCIMIALAKLQTSALCKHTVKRKISEFSVLGNLF